MRAVTSPGGTKEEQTRWQTGLATDKQGEPAEKKRSQTTIEPERRRHGQRKQARKPSEGVSREEEGEQKGRRRKEGMQGGCRSRWRRERETGGGTDADTQSGRKDTTQEGQRKNGAMKRGRQSTGSLQREGRRTRWERTAKGEKRPANGQKAGG